MLNIDDDLRQTADELDEIVDGVESFKRRAGSDSHRRTVADSADEQLRERIVPAVHRRASQYVGQHAGDIEGIEVGWDGRTYSIGLGTDSVVVESHEYGSGTHSTRAGRTGGSPAGYRIGGRPGDEPLAFDAGGETVVVEYVVHPGVEAKEFMKETIQDTASDVLREVNDDVALALAEAIR